MEPRILGENTVGVNNAELDKAIERVDKSKMYEDLSTIIICPTRGTFHTRIVQSWMKLQKPLNTPVAGPIFAESMKVDHAYNSLFEYILGNDYLNTFKYVLTIEEDNMPPQDGLIQLYKNMGEYDVVGGLYWGKGDTGFPMMFGDPNKEPANWAPQKPIAGEVVPARALGMGFNLFKLDMFRNLEEPWFKTDEGKDEDGMDKSMTQDIYFYKKAAEKGYKFACDCKILVGHYDCKNDKVW